MVKHFVLTIFFYRTMVGGKKRNAFSVSIYDTKFANAYDPTTGTYTKQAADTSFFRTTGFSLGLSKQLKWPDDYFSEVCHWNMRVTSLKIITLIQQIFRVLIMVFK